MAGKEGRTLQRIEHDSGCGLISIGVALVVVIPVKQSDQIAELRFIGSGKGDCIEDSEGISFEILKKVYLACEYTI